MVQKKKKSDNDVTTGMNDALRRKYEEICELRAKGTLGDITSKYHVASIVKAIRATPDKYGRRWVEQLAEALCTDKSLLGKEARVAECWTLAEVKSMARARSDGLVSWTHLVVLAAVTHPGKREAAFKAVVLKGLSVAGLQKHLHPEVEEPLAEAPNGGGLGLSRAVARVEGLKSELRIDVLGALAAIDAKALGRDDIDHLEELAKLLPDIVKTLSTSLDHVRQVLEQVEPPRVPATRTAEPEAACA